MTGTITIQRYEQPQAAEQLDAILPVYEEVYAEPPYCEGPREVTEFLDRLDHQLNRPGFRLVVAAADTAVIGFSFGFLLPADTQWWAEELEPLPREFTRETGQRTFAIIELAVRAPFRRRGIATRLHATLIDGLTAERVTLAVRPEPEAAPARAAYAAWGYHKVGQAQPWDGAPVYDTMMLDLARDR